MGSLVAASLPQSRNISITQFQGFAMEVDRSVIASDDHGSLLNKVYEMQCVREREIKLMNQSSLSQSLPVHLASDGSPFLSPPVKHRREVTLSTWRALQPFLSIITKISKHFISSFFLNNNNGYNNSNT